MLADGLHPMIRSLKLKNFRAFRSQSFNFSKINVFIGANSSGKSSAISALNLIAQSVTQRDATGTPVTLNGPFEQLGTFIDVVHGNRTNTPLGIELEYAAGSHLFKLGFEAKYRKVRREIEVLSFTLLHNNKYVYEYATRKDAFDVKIRHKPIATIMPNARKRRPDFNAIIPVDQTISLAAMSLGERASATAAKELSTIREVDRDMRMARMYLRRTFDSYDTLSPFRDQPQRTYLYTGETPSNVGRTGSNSVSILARRAGTRSEIVDRISEWLAVTGFAKSLSLKSLTDRHFEICIQDLDGKYHNICDVGFGCSQVLPVLIGALNTLYLSRKAGRPDPIFVVQEPEIHLHPNAQASLGSFFASLVQNSGQLFIETHSDALVLRLMRHVADGQLRPEDLAIFFFENRADGKHVQQISVNDRSTFDPPWPGGFFPQRENEALELARARNSKKVRRREDKQLSFSYPEKR